MTKVEFNEQEIQAIMQMINIAVKQLGLEAAEAGVHFKHKFAQAIKAQQNVEAVEQVQSN